MYTHTSGSNASEGSWGGYGAVGTGNPNVGSKPAALNSGSLARVEMPAKETEVEAPDYVTINVASATKYEFFLTQRYFFFSSAVSTKMLRI